MSILDTIGIIGELLSWIGAIIGVRTSGILMEVKVIPSSWTSDAITSLNASSAALLAHFGRREQRASAGAPVPRGR